MVLEEMFEDPLIALYHIAPWSFVTMVVMALLVEGGHLFASDNLAQVSSPSPSATVCSQCFHVPTRSYPHARVSLEKLLLIFENV